MSDELTDPTDPSDHIDRIEPSDHTDLIWELREVAASAEAPPPGSGAEVRAVAVFRRRRRRTTAAAAGASTAAALAVILAVNVSDTGTPERHHRHPAAHATSTASPQRGTADATVVLSRRALVVDGRTFPVSPGASRTPTPTGRMTVTGRKQLLRVPGQELGFGAAYAMKVRWALKLTAPDGTTTYIAALTNNQKAPGDDESKAAWIGLRKADARWVYKRLRTGAVVNVQGVAPTPVPVPTPTPTPTD
ncbi:L,D-transpeptidase [Streptomyces sp. NPDC002845]